MPNTGNHFNRSQGTFTTTAERVMSMVEHRRITSIGGVEISINAQTVCVHGDTPEAVEMVRAIRNRLEKNGVRVEPFGWGQG